MLPNPCPSMTLQTGAKTVAVAEAGLYFLAILYTGFSLYLLDTEQEFKHQIISTIIMQYILIGTLSVYLIATLAAIVLFFGAKKKKPVLCWAWIGYMSVLRLLLLINDIVIYCDLYGSLEEHTVGGTTDLFMLAIEVYFMYVVFAFIQHLRQVETELEEFAYARAAYPYFQPLPSVTAHESGAVAQQPEFHAEFLQI